MRRPAQRCASFGGNGEVNLLPGMGEVKPGFYFVTSPPTIARGRAIIGGWVMDNQEVNEPSGVVRAFDVLTGTFVWAWDMGRPGVHTEPGEGESYTRGTPNVWSLTSYDDALGLVYVPTGNETPDYYGAHRSEASEKYASSVVALDVENGEVRWSFQTVHHDIWDYDVPSQPVLFDLPQADGTTVPALVQGTKRGELFMLDRRTGTPLAEVREQPVPQGAVPGDWTAKTQPFSVGMPQFRGPDLTEADMWGLTPLDQLWCRIEFRKLRYEGHFTPPTLTGTLQFPGNAGGFNWGSVAIDEENLLMVVNPLIMSNRLQLYPRDQIPEGLRVSPQAGTPYAMTTRPFMSPLFVPCQKPPYGTLGVVDLKTRAVRVEQAGRHDQRERAVRHRHQAESADGRAADRRHDRHEGRPHLHRRHDGSLLPRVRSAHRRGVVARLSAGDGAGDADELSRAEEPPPGRGADGAEQLASFRHAAAARVPRRRRKTRRVATSWRMPCRRHGLKVGLQQCDSAARACSRGTARALLRSCRTSKLSSTASSAHSWRRTRSPACRSPSSATAKRCW